MRRNYSVGKHSLAMVLGVALVATASGCGNDNNSGTVAYSGKTSPAMISDMTGAQALAGNFFAATGSAAVGSGVFKPIPGGGIAGDAGNLWSWAWGLARQQTQAARTADVQTADVQTADVHTADVHTAAAQATSASVACPSSGNIAVTDNTVNHLGTATVSFNSCSDGVTTLSGAIIFTVNAYDPGINAGTATNAQLNIVMLTVRDAVSNVSMSGKMTYALDVGLAVGGWDDTETGTMALAVRDNNTGVTFWLGGPNATGTASITTVYGSFGTEAPRTEVFSGAFCLSTAGCVTVVTTTSLNYTAIGQQFPDAGVVVLTASGAAGGTVRVRLTAISATVVDVDVDMDGNGVYTDAGVDLNASGVLWASL